MARSDLMKYFQFDADDLHANKGGRFTDKQRVRLVALDKSRRKARLVIGIILAVVAAIGPIIYIVGAMNTSDPAFRIAFGIGFGLIWPLIWGLIAFGLIRGAAGKTTFKVANVRGRANIVARESRSTDSQGHSHTSIYHELHIGGVTFGVSRDIADVIFQGDEYAVYYVEATQDIISLEELGKK